MSSTLIIAEAGVNHNGDLEIAKRLIEVASDSGADYVKFQTFQASKLVTAYAKKAVYQAHNTGEQGSQYDMLKGLELSYENHLTLMEHCKKFEIGFLSTGFDIESVMMLNSLGMELFKIPSGEITNLCYLEQIASLNKPVILSTGMATLGEIEDAVRVLGNGDCKQLTILHCTTEYPTPMADVNLNAMLSIRDAFKLKVGYSDHTLGIEVPVAAVALGASVIEKHFTLDRTLPGPDHKASLEPTELKAMVQAIRNVEIALGNGRKGPTKIEIENRAVARKSIVASCAIRQGEKYSLSNLDFKRPGTGISPMRVYEFIGKPADKDYLENEQIGQ